MYNNCAIIIKYIQITTHVIISCPYGTILLNIEFNLPSSPKINATLHTFDSLNTQ